MLSNIQLNYDKKTDTLDIIKMSDGRNIVEDKEFKYGIVVSYDILGNPRCIRIPEFSLLSGMPKDDVVKFSSFFG